MRDGRAVGSRSSTINATEQSTGRGSQNRRRQRTDTWDALAKPYPLGRARWPCHTATSRGQLQHVLARAGEEVFGEQGARLAAGDDPELVRRAGRADVQEVAGFVVVGVGVVRHVDEDDVVEFEALHLAYVGHV